MDDSAKSNSSCRWLEPTLVALALAIAALGANPYAGGWNDGSRLATVEAIADRGTLAIDDSVFVRVPRENPPYPANKPGLLLVGTLDKLLVDGKYYSDKSPAPAAVMAAVYGVWKTIGGPTFAQNPGPVCWFLAFASSGLAYVLAVLAICRLGRTVGLAGRMLVVFSGSFAIATVAPVYARHVNSHEMLLGFAALLCWHLARIADRPVRRRDAVIAGFLAGCGYTTDLGIGPPLVALTVAYVVARSRPWKLGGIALVAALPPMLLHHAMNYAVGGTIGPANAVPAYLAWPGSPFTEATMTGGLKHSAAGLALYALDLLFGKKGFVTHNLPLALALAGLAKVWVARPANRLPLLFAVGWCGLGWAAYSATSNNWSGQCCSVRWFVPFLAPGYWMLALLLRDHPRYRTDLEWLTGCGTVLGILMWIDGPWTDRMIPGFWVLIAVAAVGWGAIRYRAGDRVRLPNWNVVEKLRAALHSGSSKRSPLV